MIEKIILRFFMLTAILSNLLGAGFSFATGLSVILESEGNEIRTASILFMITFLELGIIYLYLWPEAKKKC